VARLQSQNGQCAVLLPSHFVRIFSFREYVQRRWLTSNLNLEVPNTETGYGLGHSPRELDRLHFQGRVLAPYTRQFFVDAGLKAGMRVLDVGSGIGEVSFIVAELVGPKGYVLGVDRSAEAVERARTRAIRANIRGEDGSTVMSAGAAGKVEFAVGDPAAMHFEEPFDAIVGRFVLMYQSDPAASLRNMLRYLREDGVVAFQEADTTTCRAWPASPVFDEAARWLAEGLRVSGARPELGLEMNALYLDCGLPSPKMRMDVVVSGEDESPVYELLAEAVRSLEPTLVKSKIAPKETKMEGLAERMRKEVAAKRGVAMLYGLVGAWARKPKTKN